MSADNYKAPAEAGGEEGQGQHTSYIVGGKDYSVEMVLLSDIKPSPENVDIYRTIEFDQDPELQHLIDSIGSAGLDDPILLSEDNYIISGHRRFFAISYLRWPSAPCRRKHIRREGHPDWHKVLATYNTQRVKGIDALLKEAMLRETEEDTRTLMEVHRQKQEAKLHGDDLMVVTSTKEINLISERRQDFLEAVQGVVQKMSSYWPLSIRQIHYQLLNSKPLVNKPKRASGNMERHRYRNDKKSYQALVRLCKDARYGGALPMHCIDDPTRPQIEPRGRTSVSNFISESVERFLLGYNRHLSASQPHHVEVFGEKNTLRNILEPVCRKYFVPLTLGRGFCSIPVWRDMEERWRDSGKAKMVLLIVSDYDPEGFELADDAVRSLRDLHGVNVEAIRVGITEQQIAVFNLGSNPAKETSKQFAKFRKRTGGAATYEVESMEPGELQKALEEAIQAVFDMDLYNAERDQFNKDIKRINEVRRKMITGL